MSSGVMSRVGLGVGREISAASLCNWSVELTIIAKSKRIKLLLDVHVNF